MINRRDFLSHIGMGSFLLSAGRFPLKAFMDDYDITKITILHTNDVHSRIEPFPNDGSRNAGLGGAARRARLINKLRYENKHVLLLDSGDIFQGTPYFNFYGGELEMKLMQEMKYDACTMGNHDFDGGIEGFEKQMKHIQFPVMVSNYNFDDTPLYNKTKEYSIFVKGDIKIGVFGLGIELEGLVPEKLYNHTRYLDPISVANKVSAKLKFDEKCDYIICLSHLGYEYDDAKVSDVVLAQQSKYIDLILGGHTHTFMKEPRLIENLDKKIVTINQAGFAGILLGQVDLYFERNKKGKCITCKNLTIK
jgi:5'-nucleotidase